MSVRLWYPQLDVYDAIRRIVFILADWSKIPISHERLCILDFFFANPSLLHSVNMTQEVRSEFQKLDVLNQEKGFISYPSAPILFKKMEEIQKSAIQTLAGKDLIHQGNLARGEVTLTDQGNILVKERFAPLVTEDERLLSNFLTIYFGKMGIKDIRDLRRRTGLRRTIQ